MATEPPANWPGEYAGMKILDAAVRHLRLIGRPARAPEIARALLRGGYPTRGDPGNFATSVYNTLKKESGRRDPVVLQGSDKSFVHAEFAEIARYVELAQTLRDEGTTSSPPRLSELAQSAEQD